MKILFVCAGNTCRSPMAEAMLNRKAAEMGRTDLSAVSAGTHVWPGDKAARDTVAEMKDRGIDLEGRPAVQLTEELAADADLILTMTWGIAHAVKTMLPSQAGKVETLCAYVGEDGDVDDPYGCDETVYHETADQLDFLLTKLLTKLG